MSASFDLSRSRMPHYLQLASLFRNKIAGGDWTVGSRIPNVADLAVEFSVARGTIRQAMGELEGDGLIERFRGKGSFVRSSPLENHAHKLEADWASIITAHEGAEIRVLENLPATQLPAFAANEGKPLAEYQMMRRLHLRDGQPYLLGCFFLSRELFERVPVERFSREPTLPILHELVGSKIAKARQILTVGAGDIEVATVLELPLNAPIVRVHRTAVDYDGQLIYLGEGVYRGDAVRLEIDFR